MWTEECDKALEELKSYLAHPPVLSRLDKKEVLYAYIAITTHAVSLVLIRVEEGVQKPIYYVSKSLQKEETQYLPLEKAISHHSCHEEAPLLFPSPHDCDINTITFTNLTLKIRLH